MVGSQARKTQVDVNQLNCAVNRTPAANEPHTPKWPLARLFNVRLDPFHVVRRTTHCVHFMFAVFQFLLTGYLENLACM